MWDFKDFPKDKVDATRRLLEGVKLSGQYKAYTDVPVSEKLEIAEKVYQGLDRNDEFWSQFYRVLGYHFAHEKKPEKARLARLHALEITLKMMADPANESRKKEFLFLAASMHHFTGDDKNALQELKAASSLKYSDPKTDEEHSKGYDEYI